ncbi:hypothetical protein MRX96_010295 [Rhipicephalus microplus]
MRQKLLEARTVAKWSEAYIHKNAGATATEDAFVLRDVPTSADTPAPDKNLNLRLLGGPVSEGAPATRPHPGTEPRDAPATIVEKDRCRSSRGTLDPRISNTEASHHGPTVSIEV